ncbi:PilN domain-containing protein [Thalassotalea fusca]
MKKLTINLYQDELIVKQPLITLPKVVGFWGVLLVIMLGWSMFTAQQLSMHNGELSKAESVKRQNDARIKLLQQQVLDNKASAELVTELNNLDFVIENKQQLLSQLTATDTTYTAGYSQAMTQLSTLHHKDISLEKVAIDRNTMTFAGVARQPEAVPSWLARFEGATFLKGQSFSYMNLQENEQKNTQFVVSSRNGAERGKTQ